MKWVSTDLEAIRDSDEDALARRVAMALEAGASTGEIYAVIGTKICGVMQRARRAKNVRPALQQWFDEMRFSPEA